MVALQPQTNFCTFEEFAQWYPEESEYKYELKNGTIIQIPKPKGKHSEIASFLLTELMLEIRQKKLPFIFPKECLIKVDQGTGHEPDGIVLDKNLLQEEPDWEKRSTLRTSKAIKMVIEIVSNNWGDNYAEKFEFYEDLLIPEYWIVDYLGIGGRQFIGTPKQPTLSLCQLREGKYQKTLFRHQEKIKSSIFPELNLTARDIFLA